MSLIDRLLGRTIVPIQARPPDRRPYIPSGAVFFSYYGKQAQTPGDCILTDTGASVCTLDRFTAARLTGKDQEVLRRYLEYLSSKPIGNKSLALPGLPFGGISFLGTFGNTGQWAIFVERVRLIVNERYEFSLTLYTSLNSKTVFGMPFLEQVKLILDRHKEREIVLFKKD